MATLSNAAAAKPGLGRIPDLITADSGLYKKTSAQDIAQGADAAEGMNRMIQNAINATGVVGENDRDISVADVEALNAYIRAEAGRLAKWTRLHGDDEGGEETGFHLVQNDGANTQFFGQNFVNTVADGIYHLGFKIENGRLLNEDGDPNATLTDMADWLTYFHVDQSTTGTGLDRIVDMIKLDRGLSKDTCAGDINDGAQCANEMNQIIADLIKSKNLMADKWITSDDLREINSAIRGDADLLAKWTKLHGDDEGGEETGFHLVQNDGGNTKLFGKNFVDTVADGIYHMGFEIKNDRFLNEDGDANATLSDVAKWMNHFLNNTTLVNGDGNANNISGGKGNQQIDAGGGNDVVTAGVGNDLIYGGAGNDNVKGGAGDDLIYGNSGNDVLSGNAGNDQLFGGGDKDIFVFDKRSGNDTVGDFQDGRDLLDFTATGVKSFDALKISMVGADTVIAFGGNEVVLAGIDSGCVTAADFVF